MWWDSAAMNVQHSFNRCGKGADYMGGALQSKAEQTRRVNRVSPGGNRSFNFRQDQANDRNSTRLVGSESPALIGDSLQRIMVLADVNVGRELIDYHLRLDFRGDVVR